MDLTLTDEQRQVRDAAREFLRAEHPAASARELDDDPRGYRREAWSAMAELGWLGIELPEEHGGFGGTLVDACLLLEEQGRVLLASPFVPTVVLAADAILRFGTDEQRSELLPAIAAGERIVAVARTGPACSWDPSAVGVAAVRDGGDVVLDGEATLVELAGSADDLLVVVEHRAEEAAGGSVGGEGRPRLAAVLVPAGAEGVTIQPLETVGCDHRSRVAFCGVRAPERALLPGSGTEVATALFHRGAVARCAEMVGAGQQLLEDTVSHARERVAFGKPIGAFQAIQHRCADMAVDVLTSRTITHEAAWRLSVGDDRAAETVSVAKAWVSDAMARVAAGGHQVHGAVGFTAEHDPHLFSRRIRSAELDFGDAAWHRGLVAGALGI